MARSDRIPVVSLFCGAGGLDLGLRHAGFDVVAAYDSDSTCIESYTANFHETRAERRDLLTTDPEKLARELSRLEVRGVVGGPPCQGFSKGNALRGRRNDPRNNCVFAFANVVRALNARDELDFFMLENVTGLLSPRQRARYERLLSDLAGAGFRVSTHRLNAVDFRVPQKRERVLLIGLNSRRHATRDLAVRPSRNRTAKTVRDAIGDLPEAALFSRGMGPDEVPFHPNHWTMKPKSPRFKTRTFNRWRSFRQLAWDEPSPTVAYGNREIHIHPRGNRRLSVLEAMMLQGLPRLFVIKGNLSEQVTQVSNLVPPQVARAAGAAIRRAIKSGSSR